MGQPEDDVEDLLGRVRPAHDKLDAASVLARVQRRLVGADAPLPRVGRFEIAGRIGAGGMGVVYEALDPKLDRRIALKVIPAVDSRDESLAEARALAKLSHPNVVAIYEADVIEGQLVIAMELVRGGTLTQWLADTRRSPRAIVEAFLQAGAGLAAAHAAGLVHGDFKPDNVLAGDDGRFRVADFGLARPGDAVQLAAGTPQGGTPTYAAPEQHAGQRATEASDQYAFALALARALRGTIGTPDRDVRGVRPAWLRRALERGTADAPQNRFPDVSSLLAALRAGLRRRRVIAGSAALLGAVAAGAVTMFAMRPPAATCSGVSVDDVWNANRATQLRAAFAATHLAYAPALADRVVRGLDRLTGELRTSARGVCATDVRSTCLADQRRRISVLVDAWTDAPDANAVTHALDALGDVPALTDCSGTRAALGPAAPERRLLWSALEGRLAAARAAYTLGHDDAGASVAIEADAMRDGFTSVAAEAGLLAARFAITHEDRNANVRIRAALDHASAAGDVALTARAQILLLQDATTLAAGRTELDQAAALVPVVEAATRLAHDRDLDAELAVALGRLAFERGDYSQAAASYERALGTYRSSHATAQEADVLLEIADVHRMQGDYAAGLTAVTDSIAALTKLYGDIDHPRFAFAYSLRGELERKLGKPEDAIASAKRALAAADAAAPSYLDIAATAAEGLSYAYNAAGKAREAADMALIAVQRSIDRYGPNDMFVGRRKVHAAETLRAAGDLDAAATAIREGLAILTAQRDTPGRLADGYNTLAGILHEHGDLAGAQAAAEHSLALAETLGAGHPKVAVALTSVGEIANARGKYAAAAAACARALSIDTAELGPDHPDLAYDLTCIGLARLGTGDRAAARTVLERAWLLRSTNEVSEGDRAATALALARALEPTDPRAIELTARFGKPPPSR